MKTFIFQRDHDARNIRMIHKSGVNQIDVYSINVCI